MIEGKRVNLRLVREGDLAELFLLRSNLAQSGEYWPLDLESESEFKKRYDETGFWSDNSGLMVISDKNDIIVGQINYFKAVPYMPGYQIGYRIFRAEDRGRGFMTEALRIFSAYLLELKEINRLEIELVKGNTASRRVAEKGGFKYEGLRRQAIYSKGKYLDSEMFSLLKAECPGFREVLNLI